MEPIMKIYNPEGNVARVMRTIETLAGSEWGPEGLPRSEVARCLNLGESEISDEEWQDISEFAVNAGSNLLWGAVVQAHTAFPDLGQTEKAPHSDNSGIALYPPHDLFHAAEAYRLSNAEHVYPMFLEGDPRKRYRNPELAIAELYPVLFDAPAAIGVPYPVAFASAEGRKSVLEHLLQAEYADLYADAFRSHLTEEYPDDPVLRRIWYEKFVEMLLLANAENALGMLSKEEIQQFHATYAGMASQPEPRYEAFAERVFQEEWRTNPRLFLDEFLDCIRTKPQSK